MGKGGGIDLNLGTPDPVLSAIRSDKLRFLFSNVVLWASSSLGEARRSEKEVVMKGWVEKVKLAGCELAEVSKLPEEEAIKIVKSKTERGFFFGRVWWAKALRYRKKLRYKNKWDRDR